MFSSSLVFALLVFAAVAAAQFQGEGRLAAPLALFFYYGYLNEWETNQGWTTIGGEGCRVSPKCTFDEFLLRTTHGRRGGYVGGMRVDESTTAMSVRIISENLWSRSLRNVIDWDLPRLIHGAGNNRDIYTDFITYVLNAFNEDRDKPGTVQNYHDNAIDALTMMLELNTEAVSADNVDWWRAQGVLPHDSEGWNIIRMPIEPTDIHAVGRDAIDMVNLVKVWGWENRRSFDVSRFPIRRPSTIPAERRHLHLGRNLAMFRMTVMACRSNQPYPFTPLPPIDVPPYNWPGTRGGS